MEMVATASNLVEVQFDGETGFGIAVTQGFYVEIAQMLQERERNRQTPLWVEDDEANGADPDHLLCRRGLLIKPLVEGPQREEAVRRFRFLGRLFGQALREGFIVPLPLAEDVFSLVLGDSLGSSHLPRPGFGVTGRGARGRGGRAGGHRPRRGKARAHAGGAARLAQRAGGANGLR